MDGKNKINVTEEYKTLMADPSQINNMSAETLKSIAALIREQERFDSGNNNNVSGMSNERSLNLSTPFYKGTETRTNNTFNRRIDGYAGPVILASITMLFGIIFMLIISQF